jgi:hypothetical protein
MRVELTVDGGLAILPGLAKPLIVQSDGLPPDELARLNHLLASAQASAGSQPDVAGQARDAHTYTIAAFDGQQVNTLKASDLDMSAPFRELLEYVQVHGERA